jgi:hypothetical protein
MKPIRGIQGKSFSIKDQIFHFCLNEILFENLSGIIRLITMNGYKIFKDSIRARKAEKVFS